MSSGEERETEGKINEGPRRNLPYIINFHSSVHKFCRRAMKISMIIIDYCGMVQLNKLIQNLKKQYSKNKSLRSHEC